MNPLEAQRAVFASGLGANEKLVALALLNHWSRARDTFPGVGRLVSWTSLNRCTVMKAIKALEASGAVAVVRESGRANRYDLSGLTSLPERPVDAADQSTRSTPPVDQVDGTSLPERPDQSTGQTRSDPGSDPGSSPGKGGAAPPPAPAIEVYRTDGAGTRRVDPFAASFATKGEVERHVFESWARAFGKSGAVYDAQRAACLAERVASGMSRQDGDDAIAGAAADDWVIGKKTGKRNDSMSVIFGAAERYEEFRDRGRDLRAHPPRSARSSADAREAEYKAALEAEAKARQAELAAEAAAQGTLVTAPPDVRKLAAGIGG